MESPGSQCNVGFRKVLRGHLSTQGVGRYQEAKQALNAGQQRPWEGLSQRTRIPWLLEEREGSAFQKGRLSVWKIGGPQRGIERRLEQFGLRRKRKLRKLAFVLEY